jgi:hypothetical protein
VARCHFQNEEFALASQNPQEQSLLCTRQLKKEEREIYLYGSFRYVNKKKRGKSPSIISFKKN